MFQYFTPLGLTLLYLNDVEAKVEDEDVTLVEVFASQLHFLHCHLVLRQRKRREGREGRERDEGEGRREEGRGWERRIGKLGSENH